MTNKKYIALLLLSLLSTIVYAQESKTLMLKLEVEDNNYTLLDAWILPRLFPPHTTLEKTSEGSLNWVITSSDAKVLAEGIISDPQVVRAHLVENNKPSLQTSRLQKSTVIIRVPYQRDMQQLVIERTPIIYLPTALNGAKKMQKLDTRKHSFSIEPRGAQ